MTVTPSMAGFGSKESCPNCGAQMAVDQRYCLNCGHRRGDPRLPFMDAVVFMESTSMPGGAAGTAPPPPPAEQPSPSDWNASAALIAGVATLVLAIGVGFLIGRSGHEGSTQAAAPQVIKVEGGGGGGGEESAAAPAPEESSGGNGTTGKSKGRKSDGKSALNAEDSGKGTKKAEANSEKGDHGASEGVEKVLHTAGDVKLETEVEVGGACEEGTAGCEGKEFTGNFFGE